MVVDRTRHPAPLPERIYGWRLRHGDADPCAGCGAETRAGYQLRRLTPHGWVDVAGQQWCLHCWSGESAGPAGRGLGIPPPREP
jgi:hypothetical protein